MNLNFDAKTSLYVTLSGTTKIGKKSQTLTATFEAWGVPTDNNSSLRQVFIVIREGGEAIETAEGFCALDCAKRLGFATSKVNEETQEEKKVSWIQVASTWVSKGQAVSKLAPWHVEANESLKLVKFARRTVAPAVDPFSLMFSNESVDDYLEGTRAERPDAPF